MALRLKTPLRHNVCLLRLNYQIPMHYRYSECYNKRRHECFQHCLRPKTPESYNARTSSHHWRSCQKTIQRVATFFNGSLLQGCRGNASARTIPASVHTQGSGTPRKYSDPPLFKSSQHQDTVGSTSSGFLLFLAFQRARVEGVIPPFSSAAHKSTSCRSPPWPTSTGLCPQMRVPTSDNTVTGID